MSPRLPLPPALLLLLPLLLLLLLLLLLALASPMAQAQQTPMPAEAGCNRVLSDMSARRTMPVLHSEPVRKAVCSCAAGFMRSDHPSGSVRPPGALDAGIQECISKAAPAERLAPLPLALVARLEDAFSSSDAPKLFRAGRVIIEACKLPEYPRSARMSEATGTTTVALFVKANARVSEAEIVRSSGQSAPHKVLDISALHSLYQCRVRPAQVRGEDVDSWIEISYEWQLQ